MFVELQWKVRRRLTRLQLKLQRHCQSNATEFTKLQRTRRAAFTVDQAVDAAYAFAIAHRWKSLTATINGHTVRGPFPIRIAHLLHCFAQRTHAETVESYCCDCRDWQPPHQNSLFPCKMVGFANQGSLNSAWCNGYAEHTAPDQWKLDKVAVVERANLQITRNRLYLCPAFSKQKVRAWLDELPETVKSAQPTNAFENLHARRPIVFLGSRFTNRQGRGSDDEGLGPR